MGRVIKLETGSNQRTRLIRAVVVALNALARHKELNEESRDICAFISLALLEASDSIETTVQSWEKRGYWVKADRFRMEWSWIGSYGFRLKEAVLEGNWNEVQKLISLISDRVASVNVPAKHRYGDMWKGAWNKLQNRM